MFYKPDLNGIPTVTFSNHLTIPRPVTFLYHLTRICARP